MKHWTDELAALVAAGKTPTYEQLNSALNGAAQECSDLHGMVKDMGAWLSRLTVAHLNGDGSKLPEVMQEFIDARVQIKFETDEEQQQSNTH